MKPTNVIFRNKSELSIFPENDIVVARNEIMNMDMDYIQSVLDGTHPDEHSVLVTDMAHHTCGSMLWTVKRIIKNTAIVELESTVS